MRALGTALAVALLLLAGAPAHADNLDEAKAAFATGKQAFERGDYEGALAQFQRANLLAPAPSLSYNIGRAYEALGRYHDAASAFERYLELVGVPKDDDDKKFQDNLRARAVADRARPDAPTGGGGVVGGVVGGVKQPPPQYPPPQYPPPQYHNSYQPYAYQNPYAYQQPQRSKAAELELQRGRRGRAIALVVIGGTFTIVGLSMAASSPGCSNGSFTDNICWGVMLGVGINLAIVGPTLLIPGAVSLARSQKIITDLSKPEPKGIAPQTFVFPAPTFYF
jgi:hypothetical protein